MRRHGPGRDIAVPPRLAAALGLKGLGTVRWPLALLLLEVIYDVLLALLLAIRPGAVGGVAGADSTLVITGGLAALILVLSELRRGQAGRRLSLAAFVLILPANLLSFAGLYRSLAQQALQDDAPAAFTSSTADMTEAGASVYFTATVLTTTGFGDISPATRQSRRAVTAQMLSGLAVVALGIGTAVDAARRTSLP